MSNYKFKINGKDYSVAVNSVEGNNASVTVNGVNYNVELDSALAAAPAAPAAPATPAPAAQAAPAPAAPAAAAPAGGKDIVSPLPGVIISIDVTVGAAVKRGQKVAVIEAMKMENEILADCDGTVSAIHVAKGDSVLEEAKIVTIA